jgi:hypothetical protein
MNKPRIFILDFYNENVVFEQSGIGVSARNQCLRLRIRVPNT